MTDVSQRVCFANVASMPVFTPRDEREWDAFVASYKRTLAALPAAWRARLRPDLDLCEVLRSRDPGQP